MKFIFANIGMLMFRGGGENFDVNISSSLNQAGHSTELYSLKPLFGAPSLEAPAQFGRVHSIRSPWLYPITSWMHRYAFTRRLRGIRGVPRVLGQAIFELQVFLRLCRRRDEEWVVISCALPLLTFLVTNLLRKNAFVRMPGPIANGYDKFFASRSKGVIANGAAYRQIKEVHGLANLHFVNVGVFEFDAVPADVIARTRAELEIPGDQFIALYSGRLIAIKNIDLLLESWKKLIESGVVGHLLLAGTGPEGARLQEVTKRSGISGYVTFLGHQEKSQLAVLYNLADCTVLTSHYDNFPNVLIESLSCGTPCVATAVGGVPDIVKNEINGFLVPAGDADSFAASLVKIATGECNFDRESLRQEIKSEFNWASAAERIEEISNTP
ncbi:glycosyltransferase family 4 protein [Mariluticola halotolerans]|uniref:glycosyltransferase family 4 protein n=1 Tax=Mariluticola halotolerans TaxID=2909283 RepID=UPI0026E28975|nr:glycosyltransferase [Mariluticola halotolerans]UJQ96067.1 glycosyltransferase [Mariluticola halotolerans]